MPGQDGVQGNSELIKLSDLSSYYPGYPTVISKIMVDEAKELMSLGVQALGRAMPVVIEDDELTITITPKEDDHGGIRHPADQGKIPINIPWNPPRGPADRHR